jgi:hypothetical protein
VFRLRPERETPIPAKGPAARWRRGIAGQCVVVLVLCLVRFSLRLMMSVDRCFGFLPIFPELVLGSVLLENSGQGIKRRYKYEY